MLTDKKPKNSGDGAMSNHDAAAAVISTAISMQNEAGLVVHMRNVPGRGFAIVIDGWYFDGKALSRQNPADNQLVANQPNLVANLVANPEVGASGKSSSKGQS